MVRELVMEVEILEKILGSGGGVEFVVETGELVGSHREVPAEGVKARSR